MDTGRIIENIVYFELLRSGHDVSFGRIDNMEVDFIATNTNEKRCIQVTESINEPSTREWELGLTANDSGQLRKNRHGE